MDVGESCAASVRSERIHQVLVSWDVEAGVFPCHQGLPLDDRVKLLHRSGGCGQHRGGDGGSDGGRRDICSDRDKGRGRGGGRGDFRRDRGSGGGRGRGRGDFCRGRGRGGGRGRDRGDFCRGRGRDNRCRQQIGSRGGGGGRLQNRRRNGR